MASVILALLVKLDAGTPKHDAVARQGITRHKAVEVSRDEQTAFFFFMRYSIGRLNMRL